MAIASSPARKRAILQASNPAQNSLLAKANASLHGFRAHNYHCTLAYARYHFAPPMQGRVEMHQHTSHEFTYIRTGRVEYFTERQKITVNQGEFWLIPPGIPHGWKKRSPSVLLDSFAIHVTSDLSNGEQSMQNLRRAVDLLGYNLGKDARMAKVADALYDLTGRQPTEPLAVDLSRVRIEELILLLFSRHLVPRLPLSDGASVEYPVKEQKRRDLITQIISFIDTHFEGDLSLATLTNHFHYSGHHLNRLFLQEKGVSIKSYILEARLRVARDRLINTNLPIKNVAYSLGFHDVSYFCRFFKQHTLFSPQDFRARHHSGLST